MRIRDYYFIFREVPGWVAILHEVFQLPMDRLHTYADYIDAIESDYYRNHYPAMRSELYAFKNELMATEQSLKPKSTDALLPPEQIERARNFPITDLIEHKRYWALCPFHPDSAPSLFLKNNYYHCFACGETGDVIKLAMHLYNADFPTAVRALTE